mgnify:FL=1
MAYEPGDKVSLVCSKCKSPAEADDGRLDSDDPLKCFATVRCLNSLCGFSYTIEGILPDKDGKYSFPKKEEKK